MIFQHTHEWVMDVSPHTGEPKTQTRRLVKHNEVSRAHAHNRQIYLVGAHIDDLWGSIEFARVRPRFAVNSTYAVQPGRGQKAIGRIRITDIRREDVRLISDADVLAEGFENRYAFLETWTRMHDKRAHSHMQLDLRRRDYLTWDTWAMDYRQAWLAYVAQRPNVAYDAWALTFEAVTQ